MHAILLHCKKARSIIRTNGAFANNDTQYPQLGTYTTYGGLPLGLWPDYSENPLELKKLQPNVGDNLTKVWGKHVVKIGIFSQRTTNNQTATNPSTNGIIQNYLLRSSRQPNSPITTGHIQMDRPHTAIRTSTAAMHWQTSLKGRSRTGISRTSILIPTCTSGTRTSMRRIPGTWRRTWW